MDLKVCIKKRLGNFELDSDFTAKSNEVFAILGSSGCGKSMTLKCIAGIETPDSGKIVLDGITLFDSSAKINLAPQKRKIGYLFQSNALFPNMTVYQNILFSISHKKDAPDIVQQKINSFALTGLEKSYPHQLSGGQKQRVALARVFASSPKVLMLDEPFSALDSHLQWQLEQEIKEHLKTFDGQTLFVSHKREEIFRISDKIAMMQNGHMQPACTVQELFNNPKTLSALLLTGCKNVSNAKKISPKKIYAKSWGIELELNNAIKTDIKHIGIRASFLKISNSNDVINTFKFKIIDIIEDILENIIVLQSFGDKNIYLKLLKSQQFSHKIGDYINIEFDQNYLITLNS